MLRSKSKDIIVRRPSSVRSSTYNDCLLTIWQRRFNTKVAEEYLHNHESVDYVDWLQDCWKLATGQSASSVSFRVIGDVYRAAGVPLAAGVPAGGERARVRCRLVCFRMLCWSHVTQHEHEHEHERGVTVKSGNQDMNSAHHGL